ncbi:putative lipid carrier protein YhbT [Mesorhizobium soli]|uniref:ubiquinone anaerobic biosynthesis accessory factor UbiT n=1 Tax=Pseudaminobacter soli (ex Li et al. 2025) TaxID=1295366 RepID=UPI0024738488|nr:SCP2 sterol-binding domain-containing protein [Mesorhizobium soli]MDH6233735.1 putative lipid carrier protein YhbT [Mesorhizobium soli]
MVVDGELPVLFRRLFPSFIGLPLGPMLTLSLRSLARRRPQLFDRLGEHRRASYRIDPSDLAFSFIVVPDGQMSLVRVVSRDDSAAADVAIKGPILMLLGLLDGTLDGDALFFHRVISVGGRTEAVVALRNTIEDAELRPSDLLGLHGTLARLTDAGVLHGLSAVRRLTDRTATHARAEA